ncbi:hypothetical protein [Kochikohdavirus PBEF19]|uniref:Uncharacterized protein n=1 Tax=Enterococcus phage PBEF129 TaxID=2696337 RepID=A0A7T3MK58_9CAUD|nr:hypothetical protein [Enterococcus phage PBEF129]
MTADISLLFNDIPTKPLSCHLSLSISNKPLSSLLLLSTKALPKNRLRLSASINMIGLPGLTVAVLVNVLNLSVMLNLTSYVLVLSNSIGVFFTVTILPLAVKFKAVSSP